MSLSYPIKFFLQYILYFDQLENQDYKQSEKSLDRLSIHPFTALKSFLSLVRWNHNPNSCLKIEFPFPTPCLNVALNSRVRTSMVWINIENRERGTSLINMSEWSNTFGRYCRTGNFLIVCPRYLV